ncbi:MAG: hypothetical protein Kow0069_15230 [Promethearchaeota archaeon]
MVAGAQVQKWGLVLLATVLLAAGAGVARVSVDDPRVLYDQVGYLPGSRKVSFVTTKYAQPVNRFALLKHPSGEVVAEGHLEYLGRLWGRRYYAADFSNVTEPGTYSLRVRVGPFERETRSFVISAQAYDLAFVRSYQFFYYQRCGGPVEEIVPGYVGHEPCHLDDFLFPHDLTGGWHSAGDYSKHVYWGLHVEGGVWALAGAYESAPDLFDQVDLVSLDGQATPNGVPDVLDEAAWGARYLSRLLLPNGSLLGSIVGDMQFYPPELDTDNVVGTADDRHLFVGENHEFAAPYEAAWVSAGLARVARLCREGGYHLSLADELASVAAWIAGNISALFQSASGGFDLAEEVAAAAAFEQLAALFPNDAAYAENSTRHWNRAVASFPGYFFTDLGVSDRYLAELTGWAAKNGSAAALQAVRPLLERQWESAWKPLSGGSDNFHGLYRVNQSGRVSYFNSPVTLGLNSYYLAAAAAAFLGANVTGNAEMAQFAEDQLHWLLGRNPEGVCMLEGVGARNPPVYHHRYSTIPGNPRGAVPGAIPNGYTRDWFGVYPLDAAPDMPYFQMTGAGGLQANEQVNVEYRTNEPWLPHNVHALLAFGALRAN